MTLSAAPVLDAAPEIERHDDGSAVVRLTGELDLAAVPRMDAVLGDLRGDGVRRVVVDLARVTFMDSQPLRVLLRHADALTAGGGSLRLRSVPPQVRRLLRVTGAEPLLPIEQMFETVRR